MNIENSHLITNEQEALALYRDFLDEEFEKRNLFLFENIKELFQIRYPGLYLTKETWLCIKNWHMTIIDQDFLTPLLQEDFEEIIFHDAHHVSLIKNHKKIFFTFQNLERKELLLSLRVLALRNGEKWNFSEPFQSFTILKNHHRFRVTLSHPSISPNLEFRCLIRSSIKDTPHVSSFLSTENKTNGEAILQRLISQKENFIVAGATGSGKTTLLKSLIAEIPKEEHIIILEDAYELNTEHFNHTHLIAMDVEKKTLLDYCAYALRMRPDRILLGEMRKDEVIPFLLSMNTGHRGMMSTVHANSSLDAINRLALLFTLYHQNGTIEFEMILKLIAQSLDYVVYVEDKKIKEIIRVQNAEHGQILYQTVFKNV